MVALILKGRKLMTVDASALSDIFDVLPASMKN